MNAEELFLQSMQWLESNYKDYRFYLERDVVWTIQTHLNDLIRLHSLPYKTFNDYPMIKGNRRSLSADIALLNENAEVDLAIEFKYEPSHLRTDIPRSKFPVVAWGKEGVLKDIQRIYDFVEQGKAKVCYAIFVDEGDTFSDRTPHPGSEWKKWDASGSILLSRSE